MVVGLGRHGAQGGSGVDVRVIDAGFGAPAVQDLPHGGPVPAGQVRQPLVGKDVALPVRASETALRERIEDLVGAAAGDSAHQPGQLVGGA